MNWPGVDDPAFAGAVTPTEIVTVLVSKELLDQLSDEWSPPVQVQIVRTSGGAGYEMIVQTHTCPETEFE